MLDITLCANSHCILKGSCKRNPEDYDNISGFQKWDCFYEYENDDGIIVCDYYIQKGIIKNHENIQPKEK